MFRLFAAALILLACSALCSAAEAPQKRTITAMGGVPINLSAWGMRQDSFDDAVTEIKLQIEFLEAMMSTYRENSQVSRLNRGEQLDYYPIPLLDVLAIALTASEMTGGAFDITVEPLIKLWKSCASADRLPTPDELEAALENVGYQGISLELPPKGRVDLEPGLMIDLGGIAKGYFADEAVKILVDYGATRCLVDCGGDIVVWQRPGRYLSGKYSQQDFTIGIQHPRNKAELFATLELPLGAVVTSGDYERYHVIGGKRYCHIFDPRTGYPVQGMLSVTLLAPNGVEADALATAVFVMGPESGAAFVEGLEGVEAVIMSDDGQGGMEVYVSPGLSHALTLIE